LKIARIFGDYERTGMRDLMEIDNIIRREHHENLILKAEILHRRIIAVEACPRGVAEGHHPHRSQDCAQAAEGCGKG